MQTRKWIAALFGGVLMTSSAAYAQISDDIVKIGVLTDHSGAFAYLTGKYSVIAAQMAVDDFGGEVLGKPIQVITADHLNKADVASSIARRWFDTEQVDALADIAGSAVALAVQELSRNRNKTLLFGGAATTRLHGDSCAPNSTQWTYDTYALAKATSREMSKGGKSWFFLTSDYALGHSLEKDASEFILEAGGKVSGAVRFPFGSPDFSSFLLQAQGSGADIIGVAASASDLLNIIKQAGEFGITQAGQSLAAFIIYVNDIEALELEVAQGLTLTTPFYWDLNDEVRAWSDRYMERSDGILPHMISGGIYSSVLHYLKAIEAAGTDDAEQVAIKMKEMPVNDFYNKNVRIRQDGRVMHDLMLMQVKSPDESEYRGDYYKVLTKIPSEEAYRPLDEGGCPLVSAQ